MRIKIITKIYVLLPLLILLSACGGSNNNKTFIPEPIEKTGRLLIQDPLHKPLTGVVYTTTKHKQSATTANDGTFVYLDNETEIKFVLAGITYSAKPAASINIDTLSDNHIQASNLKHILLNLDLDDNPETGINLDETSNKTKIDPASDLKLIDQTLYKITGKIAHLSFTPSLGINTEAPQAEADTAGQAMPFVDIFRTARPFTELSGEVKIDDDGWPVEVDSTLGYARTKLLQGALAGSIPNGTYTILYEGEGKLEIGGSSISNVHGLNNQKGYTFDFNLQETADSESNALSLVLRNISPGEGNYIKNIRIIMPGGQCKDNSGERNPFLQALSQDDCPNNTTYESFVDRISAVNRNSIDAVIFNPDYLSFLREFKVVRMMNLMESSHGTSSCAILNNGITEIDMECVKKPVKWADRSSISDAVWGGSGRTDHTQRNGVPVEVLVALANTLKNDIWVNMPHYADDEYVREFANYIAANLKDPIKTYIEYSNETWNAGFLGHFYVESKGIEAGYNTVPAEFQSYRDEEYFARLRFYTERSLQIFNLWETAFSGDNTRLVRVLGTNQGDIVLTEQMLKYKDAASQVDAVAMAPYFFGCVDAVGLCVNAAKVLKDATTVDDVFDIIDQDSSVDPSSLPGTIAKIKAQAKITSRYNVQLLTYEGGQHLTTSILGRLDLSEEQKATYRDLFKAVNRDPRMKQRYLTLLNAWLAEKDNGATLFTLYTLPQSYYRFGNFGLKEHLNKSREESPKYDAVISFQESMGACWWDLCEQ